MSHAVDFDLETWLSQRDIERIYLVVQGELPESCAGEEELEEFTRLVIAAAVAKGTLPGNATVH